MEGEDLFTKCLASIFTYLTGDPHVGKRSGIVKKCTFDLDKYGDLCFPLPLSVWKTYIEDKDSLTTLEKCTILEYAAKCKNDQSPAEELIINSKKWTLNIEKCVISNNLLVVHFNRFNCFKEVLSDVFKCKGTYGMNPVRDAKTFRLQVDDNESTDLDRIDLTTLRVRLLREVLKTFLNSVGHFVEESESSDSDDSLRIFVTTKSFKNSDFNGVTLLCGPVINAESGKKIMDMSEKDYYSKRETDMRLMAEHKYGLRISKPALRDCVRMLGQAAVTFDLLQNKPISFLKINVSNSHCSNSKGASFVLYNCARLNVILEKFFDSVSTGSYPKLPSWDCIDANMLDQPEEWDLLYNYVLYFPTVVHNCIDSIEQGRFNPQNLCAFLGSLCSKFSVYYRRVRILTAPLSNLVPVLQARIYLLMGIQQVLHNALHLLNLKPITRM